MSDWQLSQSTVDFRNEERRAGNGQGSLFDPPARCGARACEAGDRKNLCRWAADIAHGRKDPYTPKPRGCLLRIDPAEGVIPY
jgi:hypothetical protein